jgi:hypothetical protein
MVKIAVDTKNFDMVLKEYMTFSKRSVADIINAKLYYIARNATMTTKHSDKGKIRSELEGPSHDYPSAPLGAIIINAQLGAKGEKGKQGAKMAKALEGLIKKRGSYINFVRSGWKNAIQEIEKYLKNKGEFRFVSRWAQNAPVNKETMKKKTTPNMGMAITAKIERGPRVWGEIQNNVTGKEAKPSMDLIKKEGLQKAVDKETASMRIYIERKLNDGAQRFNR